VALLQENEWKDAGLSQWMGGDEWEKRKDATVGKDCGGRDYLQAGTSLLKDTNGSQRVKMTLLMPAGGGQSRLDRPLRRLAQPQVNLKDAIRRHESR
jgi:hypothetical protein